MAKKRRKPTNLKVEFGNINFQVRSASTSIKFPIDEDNGEAFVGRIWNEFRHRRLVGSIMLGDESPSQMLIDGHDRNIIEGAFDTHKPSFSDELVTLTISFDVGEVDAMELLKFRRRSGWLVVEEITEIPEEAKAKNKERGDLWDLQPLERIGIDDILRAKLAEKGVVTVGALVSILLDRHDQHSIESLRIKGRADELRDMANMFFEEIEVHSPLVEYAGA